MRNRACLIELGNSHMECMYTMASFLNKANWQITIIISSSIKEQIKDYQLDTMVRNIIVVNNEKSTFLKTIAFLKTYLVLLIKRFDAIIFNTTTLTPVRNISLLPIPRSRIYGIVHDGEKIVKSKSVLMMGKRFDSFFVLNDYIIQNISIPPKLKVNSYYPIFLPDAESDEDPYKEDIVISIPGGLVQSRRDYFGFIDALGQGGFAEKVVFLFLGNIASEKDHAIITDKIREYDLKQKFVFFKDRITYRNFYSLVKRSHLILPLSHPWVNELEKFSATIVSGTYNLAFALKKVMLLPEEFSKYEDFRISSVFYSRETLTKTLTRAIKNPDLIRQKESEIRNYDKFSYNYQYEKFMNTICSR